MPASPPVAKPPLDRPTDEHGARAEGQRLEHVGAAADAAVEVDLARRPPASATTGNDLGQRVERRDRAVHLSAAVVGDDHRVGPVLRREPRVVAADDALEHDRQRRERRAATRATATSASARARGRGVLREIDGPCVVGLRRASRALAPRARPNTPRRRSARSRRSPAAAARSTRAPVSPRSVYQYSWNQRLWPDRRDVLDRHARAGREHLHGVEAHAPRAPSRPHRPDAASLWIEVGANRTGTATLVPEDRRRGVDRRDVAQHPRPEDPAPEGADVVARGPARAGPAADVARTATGCMRSRRAARTPRR